MSAEAMEKLEGFLEYIGDAIEGGLITVEKADVRFYEGAER